MWGVDAASVSETRLGEASEGDSAGRHCCFRETVMQLSVSENSEEEIILSPGVLQETLRNEAQHGMETI